MRVPKSYKLSHEKGTCHYCPFLLLSAVSWEGLLQTRRPTALWLQGQENRGTESPPDRNRTAGRTHTCFQLLREKVRGLKRIEESGTLITSADLLF